MNLRELAAADTQAIIEDGANGFGWPITITDPSGKCISLTGLSDDISASIDPDTGQLVEGRRISIAVSIRRLIAGGWSQADQWPRGIHDAKKRPWVVVFTDIDGLQVTTKVTDSMPDRMISCLVLMLEPYNPVIS